jgi:hypothetical protein
MSDSENLESSAGSLFDNFFNEASSPIYTVDNQNAEITPWEDQSEEVLDGLGSLAAQRHNDIFTSQDDTYELGVGHTAGNEVPYLSGPFPLTANRE